MKHKLDIVIVAVGMPMGPDTILSGKSLGGSETCAAQMAETLAAKGHHVTLVCNTEAPGKGGGVLYIPVGWAQDRPGQAGMFPKGFFDFARSVPHDLLIVQRQPLFFSYEFKSKVNLLWQHDLATRLGPSNFRPTLWNIDKILVLSEFMKKQYQSVHAGPDALYHTTRNGIDLARIDAVPAQERDRFRITFTARPERGLDLMLKQVFPEILRREPRARLHISRYDDPVTLPLYTELAELAKSYGERVENMGNLGKTKLYENYKRSRLVVYPSMFEEISCLSVNEAGACGAPFVGPWKAALPETCSGEHVLIRQNGTVGKSGDPLDPGFVPLTREFVSAFAEKVVELMHDDAQWERLSQGARRRAESWTWDAVADEWVGLAHEIIGKRSSEPRRLTKHFLFNSDVVAAKKVAERSGDPWAKAQVEGHVRAFVPFMDVEEPEERRRAIAEFYEQRSGGERCDWRTAFWADAEPRTKIMLEFIARHRDKIKTVLDFGCAHGGYARAISNAFPDMRVVGADVSPSLIRAANELRGAKLPDGRPACEHPENMAFAVADENTDLRRLSDHSGIFQGTTEIDADVPDRQFDLVVAMEVLEHLPDSEEVAKKLERHCKADGWMLFTVPTGHREKDELETKGIPPVHVRSFDLHDMRDMFGKKKDFHVTAFSDFQELAIDRSFAGWLMATYRRGDEPVGEIDWERKLFLQAPRETVSLCMIAHNSEGTLHRCLKSVAGVADQIVVLDNGPSTDGTVEIGLQYTPEVRAGTSPFYCHAHGAVHAPEQIAPGTCQPAGFETPRNESVETAWGDWVYWMDSDEQLLEPQSVWKYLRPNVFLGYGVNQYHISVQPEGVMKKDVPVRLFRNRSGLRFYGLVHEHAELGINQGVGSEFCVLGDFHVHHDGYLTEAIRRARFRRNLKLLECDRLKYPERLLGIYLYDVRDNVHMAYYDMERSGGRLTPLAADHFRKVVAAYREHFLGKPLLFAEEGLNYYSQALAALGLGIEVAVNLDVKKSGAALNGNAKKFRAMDSAEAKRILEMMVSEKAQLWEGPYVA